MAKTVKKETEYKRFMKTAKEEVMFKEKTFLVTCDAHNTILEQCDLVNGHFRALRYAIKGIIDSTGGATGDLKAIESIISKTWDSFGEVERMVTEIRKD